MGRYFSTILRGVGVALVLKAAAFDSFTLYFDVPNKSGVDPLNPPTLPPSPFTPAASWDTTSDPSNLLGLGATPPPGLRVPQLEQAFAIKGMTFNVGYTMASTSIAVQTYQRTVWEVENVPGQPAKTITVTTSGKIEAFSLGSGSTAGSPILSILNSTVVPGVSIGAYDGAQDFAGTDYATGITIAQPTGSVFSTSAGDMTALTGNSFTSLPLRFTPNASAFTDGNILTRGSTFGYAIVAVTYTYVPEASTVCAGVVVGLAGLAYGLRRRMIAAA